VACVLFAWSPIVPFKAPGADEPSPPLDWPPVTAEAKPWAYWWWMGSAVTPADVTENLEQCHAAGMGGVHVIPIYGAKGYEQRYIDYLSPEWLATLRHAIESQDADSLEQFQRQYIDVFRMLGEMMTAIKTYLPQETP